MYNFVLQTITFVSLGILVLLIARALPRLPEEEANDSGRKHNFFDRMIAKRIPLDKLDSFAQGFSEKLLRKTKVVVMKTDNFVDDRLGKVKRVKDRNKARGDIKEHVEKISESKNGNEGVETTSQDE